MERIGIIDVGSNSIRLVIVDIAHNKAYHQIENIRENVRLGHGIHKTGVLSEDAIQYAVDTVHLFVKFCKIRKVEHVIAVATAAVRIASNQQALIRQIKLETEIEIKVLTGEEEAHLGYISAINTMPHSDALVADLGGGSLKLVSYEDRIKQNNYCREYGAVTLSDEYQTFDKPSPDNLLKLEKFLLGEFATIPWIQSPEPLIGIGGTFRSLARIIRREKQYVPDITDSLEVTPKDVNDLYDKITNLTLEERLELPGMEADRADVIIAGIAIIKCLLQSSEKQKLIISNSSIRDGLLFEYLYRHRDNPTVSSVVTHHIDNLIHYYNLEENHLRRVSNLSVTIFDQLASIHQLGSFARRLLLIASLLHELGVVISVEGLDKHTVYMILNTRLHGLNHRERIIAAYVAASHDDLYLMHSDDFILNGPLKESDTELIKRLSAILQIAHGLDRCHTATVKQVQAQIIKNQCILNIIANSGVELELSDARRKATLFENLYNTKLTIRPK